MSEPEAEIGSGVHLLFDHPKRLAELYPQFLRHGLSSFRCTAVLRFLGKNRPEVFCGELTGTLKHRPEGLRLKHTVNGNSLKIYDKEAQVLRVETTINRPRDFRVYRILAIFDTTLCSEDLLIPILYL